MTEGQLEDKPQNLGQLRMTWEPGPATIINIPASLAEKSISKTRLEVLELRNIGNPPEITFHHRDVRNGEVEICVHRHMMKLSTFFKACYRDIGSDQSCNSKIRKLQATLSSALEHSPRHRNGNSMGNLFYEKLELDLGYFLFVLKEENDDCDPKVVEAQDRFLDNFLRKSYEGFLEPLIFGTLHKRDSDCQPPRPPNRIVLLDQMEPDYGRNTFDFRIRFRVDLETLYSNERELCDSDEPHLLGTQHSPLDAHLLHLWMGLSKRPSLVRTRDSLNHGIDSLLRLIRNSFREDLFQELRFRDPVQMRPDNKYPEERYKLLIHLFIKLLEVLIAWAQEREVVTEKLRDIEKYRYEDRVELTEEVLLDYCTGENWHFEEHIEKILLYSTVIVFLNEAAAPSVDERIYWYLFDE